MTGPRPDFETRLAIARRLLARGAAPVPVHVADQLDAAGREVRMLHDRLGTVLPLLEPHRSWRQRIDPDPSDDVRAHLLAAVLGTEASCVHLRRGGPQPAIIRLPLRRIDCTRCAQTLRRPPAGEADRCDVCGARGVAIFHPFAMRQGPAFVMGDGCPDCADVLGIRVEAAS